MTLLCYNRMKVGYNNRLEVEEDCNNRLERVEEGCNNRLEKVEEDCNNRLEKVEEDCNNRLEKVEEDCSNFQKWCSSYWVEKGNRIQWCCNSLEGYSTHLEVERVGCSMILLCCNRMEVGYSRNQWCCNSLGVGCSMILLCCNSLEVGCSRIQLRMLNNNLEW